MTAYDDVTLSEEVLNQVDKYMDHLKRTGRKDRTRYTLNHVICAQLRFLQGSGRNTRAEDLSVDDIHFLKSEYDACESTLKTYLNVLSRYIAFHTGVNLIKKADILWNSIEHTRKFITLADLGALVENADPYTKAALLMGSMMGLRRAEICNSRWSDIEDGKLRVYGKGHGQGKLAYLDIPNVVMETLLEARESRHLKGYIIDDNDYLIQCMHHGRYWGRMTPSGLANRIAIVGRDSGVDLTTHSLRRLYATTLYNDVGADLQTIRNMMRHENVQITINCYIKPDPSRRDNAQADLNKTFSRYI